MRQIRSVRCPGCGASVAWTKESRFRPFCSERCKQIDLGAWASGEYRVPAVDPPSDPESMTKTGVD
ncbi:MAG: DNA gyrase inhibitor YacG [Rhodocyclaceae bacterium]|jgi:endogenous inhibitor of DNA gyrase (YacG/DUF329 family)|nr:DNA gyrase inhibitor YacG [Rhodocyclaceae bacterium]MCL4759354.1 DNA gyrase inhibitor YacG [Rhodocyclaceae bacterium]